MERKVLQEQFEVSGFEFQNHCADVIRLAYRTHHSFELVFAAEGQEN